MDYLEIETEERTLRGFFHPACLCSTLLKDEVFVIIHGYFSSNKNGPNRLFFHLANHLATLGGEVYRFDLSGMGDSDGDIELITLKNQVEDVLHIINFATISSQKKVSLIGHCMGSLLSILAAQYSPKVISRLLLLSPFYISQETLKSFFNAPENITKLLNGKPIERNGYHVAPSFFKEEYTMDFYFSEIIKHKLCCHFLIGSNDQFIPQNELNAFIQKYDGIVSLIDDGDHNFLPKNSRLALYTNLVNLIVTDRNHLKKISELSSALQHTKVYSHKANDAFFSQQTKKLAKQLGSYSSSKDKIIYFIDGAIGSGKSTILHWFILNHNLKDLLYYNPDFLIEDKSKKNFIEQYNNAKSVMWDDLEKRIAHGETFIVESVFANSRKIELLAKAKLLGYRLVGIFITTSDSSINIERVNNRTQKGWYSVPSSKVIARFNTAAKSYHLLIQIADEALVIDNSKSIPSLTLYKCNHKFYRMP